MPESNHKNFNHLKIHSQYSICEGANKIDILKDKAKELKINIRNQNKFEVSLIYTLNKIITKE